MDALPSDILNIIAVHLSGRAIARLMATNKSLMYRVEQISRKITLPIGAQMPRVLDIAVAMSAKWSVKKTPRRPMNHPTKTTLQHIYGLALAQNNVGVVKLLAGARQITLAEIVDAIKHRKIAILRFFCDNQRHIDNNKAEFYLTMYIIKDILDGRLNNIIGCRHVLFDKTELICCLADFDTAVAFCDRYGTDEYSLGIFAAHDRADLFFHYLQNHNFAVAPVYRSVFSANSNNMLQYMTISPHHRITIFGDKFAKCIFDANSPCLTDRTIIRINTDRNTVLPSEIQMDIGNYISVEDINRVNLLPIEYYSADVIDNLLMRRTDLTVLSAYARRSHNKALFVRIHETMKKGATKKTPIINCASSEESDD